jgi:hypothetical protein
MNTIIKYTLPTDTYNVAWYKNAVLFLRLEKWPCVMPMGDRDALKDFHRLVLRWVMTRKWTGYPHQKFGKAITAWD